jgi:hypothetical protein
MNDDLSPEQRAAAMTPAEAVREIGWIAKEAAALADAAPPPGADVEQRTAYTRRWQAYTDRKRALTLYIEEH